MLELFANEGDTVNVGGNLFKIELGDVPAEAAKPAPKAEVPKPAPAKAPEAPKAEAPKPAPAKAPEAPKKVESKPAPAAKPAAPVATLEGDHFPGYVPGARTERRVSLFY